MDLNESLQPIVASMIENLKGSLEEQIRSKINDQIIQQLATSEIGQTIKDAVAAEIEKRVAKFNFAEASSEQLRVVVAKLTDEIHNTLASTASVQIQSYISQKLAVIDLNQMVGDLVTNKLSHMLDARNFPPQSIPQSAVDFSGLVLIGDHIKGGIIENFGSVGIEDRASHVQMTLMDHATAFEGPIWAPEVLVKGNVTVDGTLKVDGAFDTTTPAYAKLVADTGVVVKQSLDQDLFNNYSDVVFNKIKTQGLDLDTFTQGGKAVIKGNQLGYHISDSNIQRLGLVKDLQTQGEAYLSATLYVTDNRVGINTIEPSAVLSVWDDEVEITINKRSENTAQVCTPRFQRLVLGANNKQNLVLETDGSVSLDTIKVKNVTMTSAKEIPSHQGTKGQIVWNEEPAHGQPIGWVCLGSHYWSEFGQIK